MFYTFLTKHKSKNYKLPYNIDIKNINKVFYWDDNDKVCFELKPLVQKFLLKIEHPSDIKLKFKQSDYKYCVYFSRIEISPTIDDYKLIWVEYQWQ